MLFKKWISSKNNSSMHHSFCKSDEMLHLSKWDMTCLLVGGGYLSITCTRRCPRAVVNLTQWAVQKGTAVRNLACYDSGLSKDLNIDYILYVACACYIHSLFLRFFFRVTVAIIYLLLELRYLHFHLEYVGCPY